MSDSRKKFEAWWEENSERLIYENDPRRLTEEGWQAARRAALKEAARFIMGLAIEAPKCSRYFEISANGLHALAAQTGREGVK